MNVADARISEEKKDRLRRLRGHLGENIRGQEEVLDRVAAVLVRGELGLVSPRRPKGSFLFVGPTGVGKTELTNVFTSYLCDGRKPVRFDMSEYQNQSSVEKLIGARPTDIGLLGKALVEVAASTLLFDEIEKAHPLVLDLLLQILEDGQITLASGAVLNFCPFYIVLTSNIGASEAMRMQAAPFASVERTVLYKVSQQLRPELVGRVSEKLVFTRLAFETQREIGERLLGLEVMRMHQLGYKLATADSAIEHTLRRGHHKTLGARPMRNAVEHLVQTAIARNILEGGSGSGQLTAPPLAENLVLLPPEGPISGSCDATSGEFTSSIRSHPKAT
jgi:ATP-dependent Clp protease ATP-binding subunit ClpA